MGIVSSAAKGVGKKAVKAMPKKAPLKPKVKAKPKAGPAKPRKVAPKAVAKPAVNPQKAALDRVLKSTAAANAAPRGAAATFTPLSAQVERYQPLASSRTVSSKVVRKMGAGAGAVGITGGAAMTAAQKQDRLRKAARGK